jgi:hypothetical protein
MQFGLKIGTMSSFKKISTLLHLCTNMIGEARGNVTPQNWSSGSKRGKKTKQCTIIFRHVTKKYHCNPRVALAWVDVWRGLINLILIRGHNRIDLSWYLRRVRDGQKFDNNSISLIQCRRILASNKNHGEFVFLSYCSKLCGRKDIVMLLLTMMLNV